MTFAEAAWKHSHLVGGQDHNHSPDFYSRTPANIISTAKAAYTGGELATVAVNDTNFVGNSDAVQASTTRRQSHLFRFDVSTPALLVTVENFVNFSHLVNSNPFMHRIKTYIWNAVTLSWLQIAASNSTDVPRSMTGPVGGPPFTQYVDGSDKLYILIWDWEGTFRTGGGGCVHHDAMLMTTRGALSVTAVKPGDKLITWEGGKLTEALVHEVAHHRAEEWTFIALKTELGSAVVTDNHMIETETGEKRADELTTEDKILSVYGKWMPIDSIEVSADFCDVYDVQTRGPNFFVADGVAVNVMPS